MADSKDHSALPVAEQEQPEVEQTAVTDADAIVEPDRTLVCTLCGLTSCWQK